MRNLRYTLLSFIVAATAMLPGHLSAQIALTNDTDGAAFALVADGRAAAIAIDGSDAEVVTTAAAMLSSDIEAVSGLKPALTDTPSGTAVIAGTIGQSKFIDKLIADGKLHNGTNTFTVTVKGPVIVRVGKHAGVKIM